MSDTDLKEKEASPIDADSFEKEFGGDFSDDEKSRIEELSDQVGKGYTSGPKRKKSRFSRRQKIIGGGGAAVIVSVVVGVLGILQGPGQFLHFSRLLQRFHFSNNENFSDSRTGRLLTYFATRSNPNRRNLGLVMNVPATKYEKHLKDAGIEMNFDHPTRNGKQVRRIQSFTIDSNTAGGRATLDELRNNNVEVDPPGADGKVNVNVRGKGGTKLSRQVIKASVSSVGLNKVSGSLASRLLIRRAGVDFHPFKNKAYEAGQDKANSRRAYREDVREETADRDKNGVDGPNGRVGGVQEDTDEDGGVDNDTTDDANLANQELDAANGVDTPGELAELKARFGNLIKGAGLAGAGVGVVCAARGISDQAEAIEHQNIILPLIRMGTRIVTSGYQIMANNDVNADELGAISEAFYNEEDETSWVGGRSIQAEQGQPLTGPDIPDEARPSQVGQKPILFRILDNPVLDAVCGVNDLIGGLPIIKQIGQVSDGAINLALKPFGWSLEKLMFSLASLFAAEEVNALAEGAEFGNYANYGARLAANDSAISMGGQAMSDTETALLDSETRELYKTELGQKSLFARYLDLNEPGSLAAKTLYENPAISSPQTFLASLPGSLTRVFSSFMGNFTPQVVAHHTNYDYGFPEYGYTLDEQDDERLEDPLENAELIEDNLDELNERYEGCFNIQINKSDGSLIVGDSVVYEDANQDKCKNPGSSFSDGTNELIRYRMYIADMVNAHSLACYEGEESSCSQLGFSGASLSTESGQ